MKETELRTECKYATNPKLKYATNRSGLEVVMEGRRQRAVFKKVEVKKVCTKNHTIAREFDILFMLERLMGR